MSKAAFLCISLLLGFTAWSQVKLDKVISFDSLSKKMIIHTVSWTNPDGSQETLSITEMAIPVDDSMKLRIAAFNKANYGINSPWLQPKMIVIHSMDLGTLQQSLEQSSLLNDELPASWGALPKAGTLPNGVHFIIDQDGGIYCLTPPLADDEKSVDYTSPRHRWYIKRHQDGNPYAFGIENVTPANGDYADFTAAQVEANATLVRWLIAFENNHIENIASHHQFNDEQALDEAHRLLQLNYRNKPYRTTGRKDVGDAVLEAIIDRVNAFGYAITPLF